MAETLLLRVVTPERLVLDEEVDEVTAPGTLGEFGVLPNHVTFLSSLQPGRLSYKRGGQVHILATSSGFAEVKDNVMTVLADSAEFASEINVERARAALQAAEESLRTLAAMDAAFSEVLAARQRAQVRIEVASAGVGINR
ncbi:MAG: F0F1 ATP synthase subunit epsilon [Deltaproteobacteria bacterium]|nr:F0F1 ATP synthase subunit epsilon [Deltaproteobacteria bacterium]